MTEHGNLVCNCMHLSIEYDAMAPQTGDTMWATGVCLTADVYTSKFATGALNL